MAVLPQRAIEIHRMRPDIREAFDLSTAKGRSGLYWWYYVHAFREMWLEVQYPEDLKGPVNAPVEHLPVHGPLPVTWLMRQLWRCGAVPGSRSDQSKWFGRWRRIVRRLRGGEREPLSSEEQDRLISWYFCCGLQHYNLEGILDREQAAKLLDLHGDKDKIPLILAMVHVFAPDLHGRYPSAASVGWRQWCAGDGQDRFPILAHPLIRDRLFPAAKARQSRVYDTSPFGVNLIGHAGARSGVGEDLRTAARALESAGIRFVVRNVNPSTDIPFEEGELNARLSDDSPFSINMFCMAGMETVTVLSTRQHLMEGKLNIGFWPWELPEWPRLWSHTPCLMDEIWASTSFTAAAYRRSTSVTVRQVPMAVTADGTQSLTREEFGLPQDRFLFGYSFDGHSSFSRKNPEAAVRAFRLAFSGGDEPVGLVLKGLRVTEHGAWRTLQSLAAEDRRIVLISTSMPRDVLLDLYRAIDCFVSLHRSEGFGRNIAECMLLGKPVIVTDYSGNVDFTREDTAALVSANLQRVNEGEYPFGAGQFWADPSIEEAAEHMQRMVLDEDWRTGIAGAGQAFIKEHYSPAIVGERFSRELKMLVKKKINEGTHL